ncbi:hypothetical protein [Streptomyces sp. NPDC046727]|uniref:hypothetical protein n=1 Tax=Streptomyces sp. NPDC046727 TaxID=3155373 RepID=UPI0033DA7703
MAGRSPLCAAAGIATAMLATLVLPVTAHADDDGGPSARALADEARSNLLKAHSVHLKLTERGRSVGRSTPASMELALDRAGNCAGKLVMGDGGGSVELIKRGDQVWMKPDSAFWKAQLPGGQGAAIADRLRNRYLHGSTKEMVLRGMAHTCDLAAFQKEAGADSAHGIRLTKGGETKVDGTKVIPLTGTEHGRKKVLYVTSAAPHRLVKATERRAGGDQSLTFTGYDEPVPSATPSATESVDISRLRQELTGEP